jgi:hypothetical protein
MNLFKKISSPMIQSFKHFQYKTNTTLKDQTFNRIRMIGYIAEKPITLKEERLKIFKLKEVESKNLFYWVVIKPEWLLNEFEMFEMECQGSQVYIDGSIDFNIRKNYNFDEFVPPNKNELEAGILLNRIIWIRNT